MPTIKFIEDRTVVAYTKSDESYYAVFSAGDIIHCSLCQSGIDKHSNILYNDGDVILEVPDEWFEIVKIVTIEQEDGVFYIDYDGRTVGYLTSEGNYWTNDDTVKTTSVYFTASLCLDEMIDVVTQVKELVNSGSVKRK